MKKVICYFLLFFFTTVSFSTPENDFQLWNVLLVTGSFSDKDSLYWLEAQTRFGEDVSTLSQTVLRTAIGQKLSDKSSAWVGYAWFYTSAPLAQPPNEENRIWEQLIWKKNFPELVFSSRTRLEQRFFRNNDNVGWRFREAISLKKPIHQLKGTFLFAMDELFINLRNPVDDRFSPVIDQNRVYLGIEQQLNPSLAINILYLNQRTNRLHQENFSANNIVLKAYFNFM